MKNLKKVLAMVLAFACTFSMFAGAKVFEDVPAGSDYSEAITMLSDLGIIQGKDDGKYHPEDTITRAEACAMIARLMTGDPNVSEYVGAQSFADVQKGSWKDSAIGYCYINNIVIGVGNNKFEPDRAITDAEFVTMVVRAMGYETPDMKQGYPFSFMSSAQAIGLLDGVKMVANTDALRGEDAQVIYNALFTDYARGAKLVNTTHGTSVEQYPTLAESVWGLERAAVGTWDKNNKDDQKATLTNCKAHTWVVVGADKSKEGNILAYPIKDGETDIYKTTKDDANGKPKEDFYAYSFKYAGDVDAIKGYQVELWGQGKHGDPTWEKSDDKIVYSEDWEIKAVKTVKGQKAYDYNASMADSKDDNGEIVLGEETLKLESVADNAKSVEMANTTKTGIYTYLSNDKYNGVEMKDKKSVEKALNVRDGAQYKLVDWDSDGDIDWAVISEANYYKVEAVNSKRLTVASMKDTGKEETTKESTVETWKLDDLNDKKDYKVKVVAPEDLKEGDIIEVTYTFAYDKGEKEEVVTATVTKVEADTHELDKVSTKDTLELTFDGEVKKIAQAKAKGDVVVPSNPTTYGQFDDEELGTSFNLWTNRNGFIVYSDYATDSSNYLMVLDTGNGSDKTNDRKPAAVDVLFADNSVKKDVKVATDLKLKGYNKDSRKWTEGDVVGNVYKYWMNEDGVITKMEPMIEKVEDAKKDVDYTYDESADRLKDSKNSYVASLEEAKVIFAVTANYIEGSSDLSVDSGNVMAVKQADIPDIAIGSNDTKTAVLSTNDRTWLGDMRQEQNQMKYIADVNSNGEASAAILGVENFNKFNSASTKAGLVTSVSYDKNDVVTVDVAYNGKVESISSKEKVDFEDVVEQYNKSSKKDEGLTTKQAANKLKKSGAYAEITTDADGKLTNVTFMDVDVDGNTATGHYYEVSRRIITSVKSGNVAYGDQDAYYYNDKNLYSVGRLSVADKDLDKDVQYYSISGRPTARDGKYDNVKLSVANGFDGTPDIKAESDSVLINSFVNDKFDDADTYQVADLVSKINGNIVAAYAFDGSLGETDKAGNAVVTVDKQADVRNNGIATKVADVVRVAGGDKVSADVKVYEADGKTETKDVTAELNKGELKVTAKSTAVAGDYVAKFSVDKKEYKVKFAVKAADITTLTVSGKIKSDGKGEVVIKAANALEEQPAADVVIKDAKGVDVSGKFEVTKALSTNGTVTIKAKDGTVDAGTYTVEITKGGYTFNTVTFDVAQVYEYTATFNVTGGKASGKATLEIDNIVKTEVSFTDAGGAGIVTALIDAVGNLESKGIKLEAKSNENWTLVITSDSALSVRATTDAANVSVTVK